MKKVSVIGGYLKKIYRIYSNDLLNDLTERGFIDLRPSFLEILMYLCEHQNPSIKEVGHYCGLKKQTMTSHLNELEKRGYIQRKIGTEDRREQHINLTEGGERFKVVLLEVIENQNKRYQSLIGDLEIDRLLLALENFHQRIQKKN